MAAEVKKEIELEITHVLFIDIVGYSKRSINDQRAAIDELNQVVRMSEQFQNAEAAARLIKIPTGDGMALVFYNSPEEPVKCALEISRALKEHPKLQLRIGAHSGPVSGVIDVNGQANLAGAGLNTAQRVMACGDAGHILLSRHVAEDLEGYEQWRPFLHDLGFCEVKHGVKLQIVNLCTEEAGNSALPAKLRAQRQGVARTRWILLATSLVLLAAVVAAFVAVSRRAARSSSAVPEKSIAVLPFENRSQDKDDSYFADGIQDEILTRLSKIADLKVISRTSTQHYKSAPENLPEIARQLGVAHILEGSVQKSGDAVRVNVQLIKAATDSHLWADTFDRKLTDIFSAESDIAKAVADQLRAKLTGEEEQVIAAKPTDNPEAYDAYLRGLASEASSYSSSLPSPSSEAPGFYERAVQLDPNFALAWARLSRADATLYFGGLETTPAARGEAAKRALENAQKLEPDSPETVLALGYYQYWVARDYGLAKTTFERVRKSLPGSSEIPRALGYITRREGHWDQSIAYSEQ